MLKGEAAQTEQGLLAGLCGSALLVSGVENDALGWPKEMVSCLLW